MAATSKIDWYSISTENARFSIKIAGLVVATNYLILKNVWRSVKNDIVVLTSVRVNFEISKLVFWVSNGNAWKHIERAWIDVWIWKNEIAVAIRNVITKSSKASTALSISKERNSSAINLIKLANVHWRLVLTDFRFNLVAKSLHETVKTVVNCAYKLRTCYYQCTALKIV